MEKTWNTIVDGKCFSKNMIAIILIAQGGMSLVIYHSFLRGLNILDSLFQPHRLHRGDLSHPATLQRHDQDRQ